MTLRRLGLGLLATLAVAVIGFGIFVASRQNLRFEHPLPNLHASRNPEVLARGEYVVRRLANCAYCHGDPARAKDVLGGDETVPLSGGRIFAIPPGNFYAYNITPDRETGIGSVSDGQIARALRYGIGREGRALLPFMEMQGLADDDITAVISYLRTLSPVRHRVPPHDVNLLGKIVKATVLSEPVGPSAPPLKVAPRGPTVANGKYLVEYVMNCWACHTERSMKTGELVGPRFAGGHVLDDFDQEARSWAAPNLTSDKTGRTGQMDERTFVARMKAGRVYEFSPMPWNSFSRLDEDDLKAIYRYLRTVPKVSNDMGPSLIEH